jgi:hypothetical protein
MRSRVSLAKTLNRSLSSTACFGDMSRRPFSVGLSGQHSGDSGFVAMPKIYTIPCNNGRGNKRQRWGAPRLPKNSPVDRLDVEAIGAPGPAAATLRSSPSSPTLVQDGAVIVADQSAAILPAVGGILPTVRGIVPRACLPACRLRSPLPTIRQSRTSTPGPAGATASQGARRWVVRG